MLNKLKNLDSYYLTQFFFEKNIEKVFNYQTISNYLRNLDYIIELINYLFLINEKKTLVNCFLYLYRLLCHTFIVKNTNKVDYKDFRIINKEIILCIRFKKAELINSMQKIKEKKSFN